MYLLDTDHMSLLRRGGADARPLIMRLNVLPDADVVTCVVVYEEQMRGWMAEVARMQSGSQLVRPYDSLAVTLSVYCSMTVLPFDARAAAKFDEFRRQRIRIGTQDLKIAAIAVANSATLLTRNVRDFERVTALRLEDWTR